MARRKGGPILAVAGVALVGAIGYGAITSGGSSVTVADRGGGPVPGASGPEAPYAIHTLGAIGTAAQDPGGGGGGTGVPGHVGPPGIQGAQGTGSAQGFADAGDTLYFSGVNLLDPNRSATTSGQTTFGGPGVGSVTGVLGSNSSSSVGCAKPPQETDYYAIPLRNVVTFRGNPRVHLNISGGGSVTALLYQETQNSQCQLIGQGSAPISGGTADVTLGVASHAFPVGDTPTVVIRANDNASHTISTGSGNPSYLFLPNLEGV
jgi:hypothetical protein